MQQLRGQFGRGPVELVIPGRRIVVPLAAEDVGRVLAETAATPFHPASWEKRQALEKFQPHGVLISCFTSIRHPSSELSAFASTNKAYASAALSISLVASTSPFGLITRYVAIPSQCHLWPV